MTPSARSVQLLDAVRGFATTIVNPYDPQELLHRLTDQAARLTGSHGAGVMLRDRDRLAFATASDETVVEVELTQDRGEAGPCYDAFHTNRPVAVDDLTRGDGWPTYRARALELGFHAVLGVPLNAGSQTIGALNIYRTRPRHWDDDDLHVAEILAAMAAAYLLHADQLQAQQRLAQHLQTALESRDAIGQAKGILMARHGMDADAAFQLLRRRSQERNLKLRDIAHEIVSGECQSPSPRPAR